MSDAEDRQADAAIPAGLPPRALVTGGAVRVGRALVLALAELGFAVAIHCRRAVADAQELALRIEAGGGRAVVVEADLSEPRAAAGLIGRAEAALGGAVGVLVNNAAVFEADHLDSFELNRFRLQLAVNLEAPLLLAQAYARALPAGTAGLIVNLGDQRSVNPTASYLGYSISKAGLAMAAEVLARELAPRIRVNTIALGLAMAHPDMDDGRFQELVQATPMRRPTADAEIGRALQLIVRSPSMTGATIRLDSGMAMGWAYPSR
jgi:NAD(P)-dependent dehydrogenase (short-subunit alcohol dehydrogenase family)